MKLAIDIVKSILLPKLEKDTNFDSNITDATFWESFATALLDFENDNTTCKTAIYSLELNNTDRLISKLPNIYNLYVKELAENHVLGYKSKAIESLLDLNNQVFEEEVQFLSNLEYAIIDIERERIKAELPTAYESLVAELSAKDIKKDPSHIKLKKQTRVIPLYFMKYAATVCVYLSVSVQYFKFSSKTNFIQTEENSFVTAPAKEETITPEIPSEVLAEVTTVTKTAPIIEGDFAYASNKLKIVENNQKARKLSIEKAIEKYRQMLEKEFPENKVGVSSRFKALESKISSLEKELALLREREKQYIFDGKTLVLYVSTTAKENTIVLYEDTYYLKRDADFYKLSVASQSQAYKKESNLDVLNKLNKIYNGF